MSQWWSIEVADGAFPATRWWRSHRRELVEAAITHGAVDWGWVLRPWGLIVELAFDEESRWEEFRALPGVQAALDAVPDPVLGLAVYRGRGGSSGRTAPRHHPPSAGASAAALPEPLPEVPLEAIGTPPDPRASTARLP